MDQEDTNSYQLREGPVKNSGNNKKLPPQPERIDSDELSLESFGDEFPIRNFKGN